MYRNCVDQVVSDIWASCTDSSEVKLSPKSFVEPYNYTQQMITDDMLQQFKNYLRHQTTQTSFVVTVRPSVL